jgi:hypothetical protein
MASTNANTDYFDKGQIKLSLHSLFKRFGEFVSVMARLISDTDKNRSALRRERYASLLG